jgi:hypothetical protein
MGSIQMKKLKNTKKHDEKTCFRCRLHALVDELYPNKLTTKDIDECRFILMALAEASGQILSQLEDIEMRFFLSAVIKFHNDSVIEDENETRH